MKGISAGIKAAAKRYPNCRIANCDCDDFGGVWTQGCNCFGHFKDMDAIFGKEKWSLGDFNREAKRGYKSRLDRIRREDVRTTAKEKGL